MTGRKEEQLSWKTFESEEILTDKNLISYYKLRLLEIKQRQKLLGEFNDAGKYVLSDEIKKTLVKLPKQILSQDDQDLACELVLKNITLNFHVKIWRAGGNAVANLYFDERFNEQKQLHSFIAQYVAGYDETFYGRVKQVFNLVEDMSEFVNEETDLIEKQVEKQEEELAERSLILEIQAQYFVLDIFEKLKNSGKRGQAILSKMMEFYDQEKEGPGKDTLYSRLLDLFNREVMATGGFASFYQEVPELRKPFNDYSKQILTFDVANAKLKKYEETVLAPKSAGGAAKGGKSSSRGGGYKPPKAVGPYKYKVDKPAKKDKPKPTKDIMLGFKPKAGVAVAVSQNPTLANVQTQAEQAQPAQNTAAQRVVQPAASVVRTEAPPENREQAERDDLSALAAGYFDNDGFNKNMEMAAETSPSNEERDVFLGTTSGVLPPENIMSNTLSEIAASAPENSKNLEAQLDR